MGASCRPSCCSSETGAPMAAKPIEAAANGSALGVEVVSLGLLVPWLMSLVWVRAVAAQPWALDSRELGGSAACGREQREQHFLLLRFSFVSYPSENAAPISISDLSVNKVPGTTTGGKHLHREQTLRRSRAGKVPEQLERHRRSEDLCAISFLEC